MKTALILGISGSLGKAIAQDLILKDYKVIGTYNSSKISDPIFKKIELHKVDFNDIKEIDKFINKLDIDKLDLLINTIAKVQTINRFESIPLETFEQHFRTDVFNYIHLLQKLKDKFSDEMNIIFILSRNVVEIPAKYSTPYNVSKYALLGLMKCLAAEWKDKKIRVNAVSPGMMDTKFVKDIPKFVKESEAKKNPSNKLLEPKDVVKAINKILKDRYLNGTNIPV
jgi:3-oxoacyl-[acyl-carrier protein] reductase